MFEQALVNALAAGIEEEEKGECISLGDQHFMDRKDLKAWCQSLLKNYQDDEQISEQDQSYLLQLLSYHPRGKEKGKGCQGIAAGRHPTFDTRCFYVLRDGSREDFSYIRCVDNAPTFEVCCQDRICTALCTILQVHPASMTDFANLVERRFPVLRGVRVKVERHRNWAGAILMLCTRMTSLPEYLLILLVRRMVQIDTDINKLEASLPDEAFGEGGGQDARKDVDLMANILDCNMMLFFEFLQRHLASQPKLPELHEHQTKMMMTLMGIFENAVLHTHKVRCVQFLWFYIASLRPNWAEAFLSLLLEVAYHAAQAPERRLLALSYLASFLARAQFLPCKYALKTVQYLAVLAREQFQAAESGRLTSFAEIKLMVSLVQATCYIVCWWAEGFETEEVEQGVSGLEALLPEKGQHMPPEAFTPVLLSHEKPVTHIRRAVAKEFCRRIRQSRPKLAELLLSQLREVPPTVQEDELSLRGTAFFPFDPYRLQHSSMFLLGIYKHWAHENAYEHEDSDVEDEIGFGCHKGKPRTVSHMSESNEAGSDVDFTDEADVASRGFVPSDLS
ncbi:unnamed protein product [Effrenium voratum]|nr:unnamed protein product [Effrenium voratum]